jgi:DNA invertase Pin-like site-specific DNA recombinase
VTAIGYIRVSTDQQAERGISLEAQRERVRAMATVQGAELGGSGGRLGSGRGRRSTTSGAGGNGWGTSRMASDWPAMAYM